MKGYIPNDGFDFTADDASFLQNSKEEAVKNRTIDLYGSSGFITTNGATVTPNISNPTTQVDITGAVGYDVRGERFIFGNQIGITIPNLIGGNNFILVSYQNYTDTPAAHPETGAVANTRTQEQANIEIRSTFTPGDTDAGGNPFVPIANVIFSSGAFAITDMRVWLKDLEINVVGTPQIKDGAVTFNKLAMYLKKFVWDSLSPKIYWDDETLTLTSYRSSSLKIGATSYILAGLPIVTGALAGTQILIGALSPSPNTCTLSLVNLSTFDWSSLNVYTTVILGELTSDGEFISVEASSDSEVFLASETDPSDASVETLRRNTWRRRNESFQSFTSNFNDGISIINSHLLTKVSSNCVVAPGVSYVAGRRFYTANPTTISALNTVNFPPLAGTYGLWVMRDSIGGKRFQINTSSVMNAYLLGQVTYDGSGNLTTNPSDYREFTPVHEVKLLELTNQDTFVGAGLSLKSTHEVIVAPGIVGFANGDVRINSVDKIIDLNISPITYTVSQSGGSLDTGLGLEYNASYAIFAVADHSGGDFNVIASKIPFSTGVGGGVANNYSMAKTAGFYPGQKVRVTTADYTAVNTVIPAETNFSGIDTATGRAGETIASVNLNTSIATTPGSSTVATPPSGAGTVVALNEYRPGLLGMTNYRFIGVVITNASKNLRTFIQSGDEYILGNQNYESDFLRKSYSTSSATPTFGPSILDLSFTTPPMAKAIQLMIGVEGAIPQGYVDHVVAYVAPRVGAITTELQIIYSPLCSPSSSVNNGQFIEVRRGTFENTIAVKFTTSHALAWIAGSVMGFKVNVKEEWALQTAGGGFVS